MPAISSRKDPSAPMKVTVVFHDGTKWEIDDSDMTNFNYSFTSGAITDSYHNIEVSFLNYKNKGF